MERGYVWRRMPGSDAWGEAGLSREVSYDLGVGGSVVRGLYALGGLWPCCALRESEAVGRG